MKSFWPFGRRRDADLDVEIQAHLEMAERDRIARGEPEADARMRARKEFGNVAHVTEATRAVWRWTWLDTLRQDLRYGVRGCLRQPGFAAVVVFALSVAIGLNTSVFTAFNTFFLARWPVRDASRVVQILPSREIGADDYVRLAEKATTLQGLVASTCDNCRVQLRGRTIRLNAVSANFFSVLGVPMAAGRTFGAAEAPLTARASVVVLSHRLWQRDFGANREIVGTSIDLDDVPFVVVGVAAATFTGITIDDAPEVWVPLSALPVLPALQDPGAALAYSVARMRIIGRLGDGVSRETAQAELTHLVGQLGPPAAKAQGPARVTFRDSTFVPLSRLGRATGLGLTTLASLLVLLLACANVSNLLLARAAARTLEMAVRLSLGASRRRLVRQLLTESALLATAACAAGLLLSMVLPQMVINRIEAGATRPMDLAVAFVPDLTVALYGCMLAVVSVIGFGLAPALLASRQPIGAAMKQRGGALAARLAPRRVLLIVQVTVSVVLLVSTGLIVRSVRHVLNVDLGFDLTGVAEVAVQTPPTVDPAQGTQGAKAFFDLVRHLETNDIAVWGQAFGYAGVCSVATPDAEAIAPIKPFLHHVTPGFFSVMKMPIVAGQSFDGRATDAILVDESLATRLFPTGAVGRVLLVQGAPRRIVGVVRNADLVGVSFTRDFDGGRGAVYEPLTEGSASSRALVRLDQPGSIDALTAVISSLNPKLTLGVKPLSDRRDQLVSDSRIGSEVAGVVGILALGIATIGIAGMFGYLARQREREIGIRLALGASRSQILRGVFGPTVFVLASGIVLGFGAAAMAAQLIHGFVHPSVGAVDLLTYVVVGAVLSAAALAAALGPAQHASRVNPVQTLKAE